MKMLTPEQVEALLKPINPNRVMHANGQSHIPAFDVAAHLTRVFGFGGWDTEDCKYVLAFESANEAGNRWTVGYTASIRLIIKNEDGEPIAHYENGAGGDAINQPSRGDAHHLAMTTAISTALKRCAAFGLADQFGLSLYNKGNTGALVKKTLIGPGDTRGETVDLQSDIQTPESLGNDERQTPETTPETTPASGTPAAPPSNEPSAAQKAIREHPRYKVMATDAKGALLAKAVGHAVTSIRALSDEECEKVIAMLEHPSGGGQ